LRSFLFLRPIAMPMIALLGTHGASARPSDAPQAPATLIEVADIPGAAELVASFKAKGWAVAVPPKNMRVVDGQTNCVVWIGRDVPLETLRRVLPEALRAFPHLKFFHILGDRGEQPPPQPHRTIHIGGSIEAALVMKLKALDPKDLASRLASAASAPDLHRFLHEWNLVQAKEDSSSTPKP